MLNQFRIHGDFIRSYNFCLNRSITIDLIVSNKAQVKCCHNWNSDFQVEWNSNESTERFSFGVERSNKIFTSTFHILKELATEMKVNISEWITMNNRYFSVSLNSFIHDNIVNDMKNYHIFDALSIRDRFVTNGISKYGKNEGNLISIW